MILLGFDLKETINGWIQDILENIVWRILYYIEIFICRIIALVEEVMMIFTGEDTVRYNNKDVTLIDMFFEHDAVRGIYGAVAIIGIVFAFGFAIVAVIRKVLDLRDKQQGVTLGVILGNLFKSILIIASMNFIMAVAITTTNELTKAISVAVQNGEGLAKGGSSHTFTDEEYACMSRIINTIGNYSVNPSYRSRYNLNACYNEIRPELKWLGDRGVFNFEYKEIDKQGREVRTWQSVMLELAQAYDYTSEAPLDSYDEGLTNAMLDAMDYLQKEQTMKVLSSVKRSELKAKDMTVPIDRILFLSGTMANITGDGAAARNKAFNKNPSFFDSARLPFYTDPDKIYDFGEVKKVFDPAPTQTNYVLVYFAGISVVKEMIVVIVTCSLRIFNLLALYIASPLAIAAMPLDDGGKFKQWLTAFIVQLLSIVGMVLSLRLFLMFLPIIWSPSLQVGSGFFGGILTLVVKMLIMYGAIHGVNKVNGIFTGILADSAGYQAITAGTMRDTVENSSVGKKLSGMSAGAMMEKAGDKVGEGAAKLSGKMGLGKVTDALGITSGAEASAKNDPGNQQAEKRKEDRTKNALKRDLESVNKTGKHLNGKEAGKDDAAMMKHTLDHMEKGASFKDAQKMAKADVQADKADIKANAMLDEMELRNPPPARENPPSS